MAGAPPLSSAFCHVRYRRMRRVLWRVSRVWTVLWGLWPIRTRLPRLRYGLGWRSAVLHSRPWLLRGPRLLRLGSGALVASSSRLDPRPLRSETVIKTPLILSSNENKLNHGSGTANDRS